MAIVFAYTVATNIVVVTGGTSGTPATFADFVTADRAGAGTSLRAAIAGGSNITLTYPVRPVELLAIVLKCVVASKTTETDYIFITGTDAWGAAQTESIDVSAGNGTYTTTKRWATATKFDCSDNAAGGGTAWANGTIAVTQDIWGVIWDKTNAQYQIDAYFSIGNGSTSTYFISQDGEMVHFKYGIYPTVKGNATCQLGVLDTSYGIRGVFWSIAPTDDFFPAYFSSAATATILCYASMIELRSKAYFILDSATSTFINCTLLARYHLDSNYQRVFFWYAGTVVFTEVYVANVAQFSIGTSPSVNILHIHKVQRGLVSSSDYFVVASYPNITAVSIADVQSYKGITVINSTSPLGTVQCSGAGKWVKEQYTCDVNVADKAGSVLAGVAVDCIDQFGTAVWAAGTVTTDANGNITQQIITHRYWVDAAATLTNYSPHKFTILKTGYQTLVLDAITVAAPIKWHLELQGSSIGQQGMAAGFIN